MQGGVSARTLSWPRRALILAACWLAGIFLVTVATRPYFPVDETRYLAVAWDMWLRGDYLVPRLNGAFYPHKPPLLFWLIDAGWYLFGLNAWWPRLVSCAASFGALALTALLARLLWPGRIAVFALAPLVIGSTLLWIGFSSMVMFDLLLTCFVLVAIVGLIRAAREGGAKAWMLVGLGIGGGLLAKGPVVLVHVLPLALLAPWWSNARPAQDWRKWYLALLGAVILGAAIVLAWAIPAAIAGGDQYARQIFWQQSANRMVQSFAHRRPLWWYLPSLPLILFPWLLWLPTWQALKRVPTVWSEGSTRLVVIWFLAVLVVFSLLSGKQWHYLLPAFPAFALLLTRLMSEHDEAVKRANQLVIGAITCLLGIALFWLPRSARWSTLQWDSLADLGAAIFLAVGVAMIGARFRSRAAAIGYLGSGMVLLFAALHIGLIHAIAPAYDMRPIGRYLHSLEQQGAPLAHMGKYHGQFHFAGRLTRPLEVIARQATEDWARRHPNGYVIGYTRRKQSSASMRDAFVQPYRGQVVHVWSAAEIMRTGLQGMNASEDRGGDGE